MNARVIARLLGILLAVLGCTMGFCLPMAFYYDEKEAVLALGASMGTTVALGGLLFAWGRASIETVYRRDALAVVGLGWVLTGLLGAIPFYWGGVFDLFVDAFFEAVSGFTTTGATVLEDIEAIPKSLLLWRTITHWLGGMGIIVLFVAIFPQLGVGAKQLFRSEVPGPITEGLRPKIKETALALWKIYLLLTGLMVALLVAVGVAPFEALCHAMSTIATGGFSLFNKSIGHYDSVVVDAIVSAFMLLAGINFSLYYLLMRGHSKAVFRNAELRFYIGLVVGVTAIITLVITPLHGGVGSALRFAGFQTLAILTGTGFGTDDYMQYPSLAKMLLIGLMFIGGCAGSTAGGIKIARIVVLLKVAYVELVRAFRPQVRTAVRLGGSVVDEETVRSILIFFASFIGITLIGSLFMASLGLDLLTSFSSVLACLANVGPGMAEVGPVENYAHLPSPGKAFLILCMLLGRLELGTLLVLFVPSFWRR